MGKVDFVNNITRTFHKVGFQLKKHSPEILITAGVIGTVASAVMACKATTKLDSVTDKAKKNIAVIHDAADKKQTADGKEYTEKDKKKDLTIVYTRTGLDLIKLYGPSVALGAISIGCILTSHRIIRKRNVALAAAYATVDSGFKDYRKRVVERFGEELDKELKYNIKAKEIEETVVDENGKETTVKKTINVVDPNLYSEYARIYDDGCVGWTKDPEDNLVFLKLQQGHANDLLKAKGHLFLNEVYEMLGFPKSKAGQIVGWVYDENDPLNDNFVDFGIYDLHNAKARDFVNGYERVIILDFNVNGKIIDLLA